MCHKCQNYKWWQLTIDDENWWWQSMITTDDDKWLWQLMITNDYDNLWWQVVMTIDDQMMKVMKIDDKW